MNNSTIQPTLVLASSSAYRRGLLSRLQIPFTWENPDINEAKINHESATDMVIRLAREKAKKIACDYPSSIIIGSDQVALLHDEILTKPGNYQNAVIQLQNCSNQSVIFKTGICVMNTANVTEQADCISFIVKFRKLESSEIDRYLEKEKPFNCAGSFKSEGLGISLIEYMQGDDPTALIGLPLIRLTEMLRCEGMMLP